MLTNNSNKVFTIVEKMCGHSNVNVFNGKVVSGISFVDTNYVSIRFDDDTCCVIKYEHNVYPEEEYHQTLALFGNIPKDDQHELGLITDAEIREHDEAQSAKYYKNRMGHGVTELKQYIKYHGEDWVLEQLEKFKQEN
ncbi:MAG: hypothetical protein QQN63_00645 [Nitrosopumilus sp.]